MLKITSFYLFCSNPQLLGLGPDPPAAVRRSRVANAIRRLRSGPDSARAFFFLFFSVF
jgi:hypothetical protein